MKRLLLYLFTALLAFLIGISATIAVNYQRAEQPHLEPLLPPDLFYIDVPKWGRLSHGYDIPKFIPLKIRTQP